MRGHMVRWRKNQRLLCDGKIREADDVVRWFVGPLEQILIEQITNQIENQTKTRRRFCVMEMCLYAQSILALRLLPCPPIIFFSLFLSFIFYLLSLIFDL